VSTIGPVTWSESTWAGIYQHHKGEADAEFVVTPSKPSCGGRAEGTHHLSHDVTCLGLVSVERCRSGGRKTLEDKVAQEVKEATAKLSSTDS